MARTQLLGTAELAKLLRVSTSHVNTMRLKGLIRVAFKSGFTIVYARQQVSWDLLRLAKGADNVVATAKRKATVYHRWVEALSNGHPTK